MNISKTLSLIDFIPDNLLIDYHGGQYNSNDYEYAADADLMIDIAAFATSAFYNKQWLNKSINYYFDNCALSHK